MWSASREESESPGALDEAPSGASTVSLEGQCRDEEMHGKIPSMLHRTAFFYPPRALGKMRPQDMNWAHKSSDSGA